MGINLRAKKKIKIYLFELKGNLKRAREYAAGNPRIKAIIVEIGAIIKLLVIEEYNSGLRSSPFQLANVGEYWSSGIPKTCITPLNSIFVKLNMQIQKIGNKKIIKKKYETKV